MASKNIQKRLEDLFTFKSDKDRLQFETEILHLDIMHQIKYLMDKKGLKKVDIALELGTSKGYITQLFTADKIVNLKTLAKLQRTFQIKFDISHQLLEKIKVHKPKFKIPKFPKQNFQNFITISIKDNTYEWRKISENEDENKKEINYTIKEQLQEVS